MTDLPAFLLLYQEPTHPVHSDVRAATMTKTFVDREEQDEDYGPVAGTKTLTEVREETDEDEPATRYGAVPRRRAARRAALAGTQTMRRDGGGGTDQDPASPSGQAVPVAGTVTVRTDNSGANDADEDVEEIRAVPLSRDRAGGGVRAGTQTMTKSTEEAYDQDPTAPSFAVVPQSPVSR